MFPNSAQVKQIREDNPKGRRVELVSMTDPYTTLKPGDQGTVNFVDDAGTIFVNWDSGSKLGVVYGVDIIKNILN
ncbi:hypothetical protein PCCS19_21690 [Paenibacillus sp. CCS19]|uniref:DUF4314 domain-containing protein n=1 Tax=Paenibacillus sp. CCS19 TaxID=3158387 RepID=UPI00255E2CA6|nr:DUF4314 domain-containing protein [Paenibacillus cellulosilyticus]GMK39115.1 hypothetical protein PCCS19_21690 [Paenibacillus cellulosilyticus]